MDTTTVATSTHGSAPLPSRARHPQSPPTPLVEALSRVIEKDRILDRPIDRIAKAADASFYRLVPQVVVLAKSEEEILALFRLSHERNVPLTFRAAGTSLSGQSVTDGVLVEVAQHWRSISVLEEGRAFQARPGMIGASVNALLKAYRVKMGPDPASSATCTLGGILSNNASGMCCGVTQNAYHTLRSLRLILPSGTVVDTGDPAADDAEQVFANNRESVRTALANGAASLPSTDDVIAARNTPFNPFYTPASIGSASHSKD